MPTSIDALFAAAGLKTAGVVPWGTRVPESLPGIYAVSWSADPSVKRGEAPTSPPSRRAFDLLLDAYPDLAVEGTTATLASFSDRLSNFWLANEPVLYIGKAGTSIGPRVGQYYTTRLGARSPHSGGWWLKMIAGLEDMFVHYAECEDPDAAEQAMLSEFRTTVDAAAAVSLHDPDRIAPFANVDTAKRLLKRHGRTNYKDGQTSVAKPPPPAPKVEDRPLSEDTPAQVEDVMSTVYSQRVTDADRTRSNLRILSASKHVFPSEPSTTLVEIDGTVRDVAWRPNGGRSGTLSLGVEVMRGLRERDVRIPIDVLKNRYVLRLRRLR